MEGVVVVTKESTFSFLKPDGKKFNVLAEFLHEVTSQALVVVKFREVIVTQDKLDQHYVEYINHDFFQPMCQWLMSDLTLPMMVIEGDDAVSKVRGILGSTYPWEAGKGTLRQKYGSQLLAYPGGFIKNVAHGSDSPENGKREEHIWLS